MKTPSDTPSTATQKPKKNQQTIKVYDSSHRIASELAARFNVSMSALINALLIQNKDLKQLNLPPRDPRTKRMNSRSATKAVA